MTFILLVHQFEYNLIGVISFSCPGLLARSQNRFRQDCSVGAPPKHDPHILLCSPCSAEPILSDECMVSSDISLHKISELSSATRTLQSDNVALVSIADYFLPPVTTITMQCNIT